MAGGGREGAAGPSSGRAVGRGGGAAGDEEGGVEAGARAMGGLAGLVDAGRMGTMRATQGQILAHLQEANGLLGSFNEFSEQRFAEVAPEMAAATQTLAAMQTDLFAVLKKINAIKRKIEEKSPGLLQRSESELAAAAAAAVGLETSGEGATSGGLGVGSGAAGEAEVGHIGDGDSRLADPGSSGGGGGPV